MDAPSDEMLMAYADGELDGDACRRVEEALASRPELRARLGIFLETHRRSLSDLYRRPLHEPIPPALLAAVLSPERPGRAAAARPAGSLAAALRKLAAPFASPWPMALAASLAVVFALGAGWSLRGLSTSSTPDVLAFSRDGLAAGERLSHVLETVPSGAQAAVGEAASGWTAKLVFTLASKTGGYCRQYEAAHPDLGGFQGLACRDAGGAWRMRALASEVPEKGASGAVRPAAGPGGQGKASPAIESLVDRLIDGDPLSGGEEADLIRKGWRTGPP